MYNYLDTDKSARLSLPLIVLLGIEFCLMILDGSSYLIGIPIYLQDIIIALIFVIPAIVFIIHAYINFGLRRFAIFVLISGIIAAYFELNSLSYGNNHYANSFYSIHGFPLYILAYWMILIYVGYCLADLILSIAILQTIHRMFRILVSILIGALTVTTIDVFFDPVFVAAGYWTWSYSGPAFYGIPIINFVTWFVISAMTMSIVRLIDLITPAAPIDLTDVVYNFLPIAFFAEMLLWALLLALKYALHPFVIFIGATAMALPLFIAVLAWSTGSRRVSMTV